jgi:hypothetical protein
MAVQEGWGEEVVASEMWYPRTNTKSVTTRSVAIHELDSITEEMAAIAGAIRSEDWTPRISNDCKRCIFRRSCPAWAEGRGAFLT